VSSNRSALAHAPAASCLVCGARLDAEHVEPAGHGFACAFCGAIQDDGSGGQMQPLTLVEGSVEHRADIGPVLHEAREELGRTLEEASTETMIRPRYLQALEEDASLDPYPGKVYRRFFLREYAEYLGLDPRPLLDATDAEDDDEPTPLPPLRGTRPPRRAWRSAAIASSILLLVVVGVWARTRGSAQPTFAAPPASAPLTTQHASSTGPHVSKPSGIHASLAFSGRAWVAATGDGASLGAGRTYLPGDAARFDARRTLTLTIGNGSGTELTVNGRPVSTGSTGQVVRVLLSWDGGRLLIRRG